MSTVCWGAVKVSNIFGFSISQGSVATHSRWCGNRCDVYIENFLANQLVEEFENRSTFAKIMIRRQRAYFFGTRRIMGLQNTRPHYLAAAGDTLFWVDLIYDVSSHATRRENGYSYHHTALMLSACTGNDWMTVLLNVPLRGQTSMPFYPTLVHKL